MIRALEPDKDYIIRADRSGIVVDVVEVVRCGECRYYRNGGCLTGRYDLKDNDFCSWGERREDENL